MVEGNVQFCKLHIYIIIMQSVRTLLWVTYLQE